MKSYFDKRSDAASYDPYAEAYGRYIERLAAPLGPYICQLAHLKPGDRVLDVGTGSGLAARSAMTAVAPHGEVIGVDLSKGMLTDAQNRGKPPGAAPLNFSRVDAEALSFPDQSFDAAISLCAVPHFPNITQTLGEMFRVLKPGGHVVVSFGQGRPHSGWPLIRHFVKEGLRELRQPFHPCLRAPRALTRLAFETIPAPDEAALTEWSTRHPHRELAQRVRQAGFANVKTSWLVYETRFDSAEEFWEAQAAIVTIVRKRLESASPTIVETLHQKFTQVAQQTLERGGELIYPFGAFFVSAVRPQEVDPT